MSGYPGLCYSTVIGQEKAVEFVSRSLQSERVPHAFIFKGPDGVGKKLFGRGLAAALNCRDLSSVYACGHCSSCKKILADSHPDSVVITPDKGMIKINQVREMIKLLEFPPYESHWRVVLLEDVHTMRQEAANSLLKTLEEPPEGNVLILTADISRELLTTISSRCQVVPFYNLEPDDTADILCSNEPDMDQKTARLLARLSEGSPGRGIELYRADMVDLFRRLITVVSDTEIDGDRDVHILLSAAREMADKKEQLFPFLGLFRLWLRDLLFSWYGLGEEIGLGGLGLETGRVPKCWSSEDLFAKLRAVDRAELELRRNCNRMLVCEVLLFKLHAASRSFL
ncbi:DNA polymerase III subunit delta' [Desulfopila sp. IMCC35008]|uniref:DNA polymerase III subunit delta' n=1 Tax=Desulfopila sp. IMCC35008 TaxID=2653858 RepID=UPI0013D747A0|nr:DNA polymerase III subunit delta' [Desulfopila sp. IMCC35008]